MNKNINIERHYEKIMQSWVNLFEITSNETVEKGLDLLSKAFSNSNEEESCRDRVYLRRGIFDKLIEDTGGIVKLSNIGLENLANPEDDYITAGVLTPILLYGARTFSQDYLNIEAVDEIKLDREYQDGEFDNIYQYIADYIGKKAGIY